MDEVFGNNAERQLATSTPGQMMRPTLTAHMEQEKTNLEARLAEVNEAIAALKANPEIERVLNLVGKVKSRY